MTHSVDRRIVGPGSRVVIVLVEGCCSVGTIDWGAAATCSIHRLSAEGDVVFFLIGRLSAEDFCEKRVLATTESGLHTWYDAS